MNQTEKLVFILNYNNCNSTLLHQNVCLLVIYTITTHWHWTKNRVCRLVCKQGKSGNRRICNHCKSGNRRICALAHRMLQIWCKSNFLSSVKLTSLTVSLSESVSLHMSKGSPRILRAEATSVSWKVSSPSTMDGVDVLVLKISTCTAASAWDCGLCWRYFRKVL